MALNEYEISIWDDTKTKEVDITEFKSDNDIEVLAQKEFIINTGTEQSPVNLYVKLSVDEKKIILRGSTAKKVRIYIGGKSMPYTIESDKVYYLSDVYPTGGEDSKWVIRYYPLVAPNPAPIGWDGVYRSNTLYDIDNDKTSYAIKWANGNQESTVLSAYLFINSNVTIGETIEEEIEISPILLYYNEETSEGENLLDFSKISYTTQDNTENAQESEEIKFSLSRYVFVEEKIAIIGNNSIEEQWRAFEPNLIVNTNGTANFTFKVFYSYIDNVTGEKTLNPFVKYLINERKIKVKWLDKWYDLVIKSFEENSSEHSITYTCIDSFINELSKNGYNIEFDEKNDKYSNQDTAENLAKTVLVNTDWRVDVNKTETIKQMRTESVYEVSEFENSIMACLVENAPNGPMIDDGISPDTAHPALIFYSSVVGEHEGYLLFLLNKNEVYTTESPSTQVVNNCNCYYAPNITVYDNGIETVFSQAQDEQIKRIFSIPSTQNLSIRWRGEHPVLSQKTVYSEPAERYVGVYQVNGKDVYGYTKFTSYDEAMTSNLVVNSEDFDDNSGWLAPAKVNIPIQTYPTEPAYDGDSIPLLGFKPLIDGTSTTPALYKNTGLRELALSLPELGIQDGDTYIFRYKAMRNSVEQTSTSIDVPNGTYFIPTDTDLPLTFKFLIDDTIYSLSNSEPAQLKETYKELSFYDTYIVGNYFIFSKVNTLEEAAEALNSDKLYVIDNIGNEDERYVKVPPDSTIDSDLSVYRIMKEQIAITSENDLYNWFEAQEDAQTECLCILDSQWIEYEIKFGENILTDGQLPLEKEDFANGKYTFGVECNTACWLQAIQFYKKTYNRYGELIEPGEVDYSASTSIDTWYYYDPKENVSAITEKEVKFLKIIEPMPLDPSDPTSEVVALPWEDAIPVFPTKNGHFTFEKIRTISMKESNCFNLLQQIAETFECWVKFEINHNPITGELLYDEGTYTPQKYVYFTERIGQETGLSFTYGLDLRSVSRTVDSNDIVTKLIVPSNNQAVADGGYCGIGDAKQNYSKLDYILDFGYYISQGLINPGELNKDLYLNTPNSIGLYYWSNKWAANSIAATDSNIPLGLEITKREVELKTYNEKLTAIEDEIQSLTNDIINYTGTATYEAALEWIKKYDSAVGRARIAELNRLKVELDGSEASKKVGLRDKIDGLEVELAERQASYYSNEALAEEYNQKIKAKTAEFFNKYSRFIQEGVWKSEEEYDAEEYYLDALSVAYSSSRPKVSYNISVARISDLDEFKNRKFALGDICYIEDEDFFGVQIDGTPNREQVVVNEISYFFESPEEDNIKVQNYKEEFEDLFQRITATTQNLQYASGAYAKAANIVNPDGTIKAEVFQSSINTNNNLVLGAMNQGFIQDSSGLTVMNTSNPNELLKITSAGLFISSDGGNNWRQGVNAYGVSTQALSAGSINTSNITITDGEFTSFRWDSTGINAYFQDTIKNSADSSIVEKIGINLGKFVRFDQFGVYGIENDDDGVFDPLVPQSINVYEIDENSGKNMLTGTSSKNGEALIWDKAKFGMTWKGFFVKNQEEDGYVEVSSENDIAVVKFITNIDVNNGQQTETNWKIDKVKIGRLRQITDTNSINKWVYGIQIRDDNNEVVMETSDEGNLWLKDTLYIGSENSPYDVRIGELESIYTQFYSANDTLGIGIINKTKNYYIKDINDNYNLCTLDIFNEIASLDNCYYKDFDNDQEVSTYVKVTASTNFEIDREYFIKNDNDVYTPFTYNENLYSDELKQVFNSNSNFIIYSDGSVMVNNGSFEGSIHAISGSFGSEDNVKITENGIEGIGFSLGAISTIGGFTVEENRLYGDGTSYDSDDVGNRLELISDDGNGFSKIKVSKIDIGNEAKILDYLQLGEKVNNWTVQLLNPEGKLVKEKGWSSNGGAVFKSWYDDGTRNTNDLGLTIYKNGFMSVGHLTLDGQTSEIRGTSFSITPELATFKNANITGKISTAVFETNKIQSVGGAMLFSDSYKIIKIDNSGEVTKIEVEGKFLDQGSNDIGEYTEDNSYLYPCYIALTDTNGTISNELVVTKREYSTVSGENVSTLYLNKNIRTTNYFSLIYLGQSDFMTIGINSGSASNSFLNGKGLTMKEPYYSNANLTANFGGMEIIYIPELKCIQITGKATEDVRIYFKSDDAENNYRYDIGTKRFKMSKDLKPYGVAWNSDNNYGYSIRYHYEYINDNDEFVEDGPNSTMSSSIQTLEDYGEYMIPYIYISKNTVFNRDEIALTLYVENELDSNIFENILNYNNILICKNNFLADHTDDGSIEITIANNDNIVVNKETRLFLGDLSSLTEISESNLRNGYGLYADNVYLKGTLTTKANTDTLQYAGMNTLSGVTATIFKNNLNDESNIIFWAGADGANDGDIRNAKFQVTQNGSIYTQQAYIANSTIVGAELKASKIISAVIEGDTDNSNVASLKIYNTAYSDGIQFMEKSTDDKPSFSIRNDGFCIGAGSNNNYFIKLNSGNTEFYGNKLGNDESYYSVGANSLSLFVNNAPQLKISPSNTSIKNDTVFICGDEGENIALKYVKSDDGIDIYFISETTSNGS